MKKSSQKDIDRFLDTETLSVGLRAFIECEQCATPLPVNQLGPATRCHRCGHEQPTGTRFWHKSLPRETLAWLLIDGQEVDAEHKRRSLRARLRWPACPACDQEVPSELLPAEAPEAPEALRCPGCGEDIPCRAATQAASVFPGAALLVGEDPEPSAETRPAPSSQPVVFQCMQCGGALTVDGSERRVRCTYCQADNFLPDSLWQELQAQPTAKEVFVVARPSVLDRWRLLLVAHPEAVVKRVRELDSLPEGLLDLCLEEPRDPLNAALAHRSDLPAETLRRLARRSKAAAREILRRRDVSPALLVEVAGLSEELGWLAAENPNLPADELQRLVRDLMKGARCPTSSELKRWTTMATNPSTPISMFADCVLAALPGDYGEKVSRSAPDPKIHDRMRAQVARRSDLGDLPARSLRALLEHGGVDVALALAANPMTPVKILRKLALHSNPEVRRSTADHPRSKRPGLRDRWSHHVGSALRAHAVHFWIAVISATLGVVMFLPGLGISGLGIPPVLARPVGNALCPSNQPAQIKFSKSISFKVNDVWRVQCGTRPDARRVSSWLIVMVHLPLAFLLSLICSGTVIVLVHRRRCRRQS